MTHRITSGLEAIGTDINSSHPDGQRCFFLYVEAADAVIGASLYQEHDDHVAYIDASRHLVDLLFELWKDAEESKKWGTMQYELRDDRFEASFDYEHRMKQDDLHDYRQDALVTRFGNKTIIYPLFDYEAEIRRAAADSGGMFDL